MLRNPGIKEYSDEPQKQQKYITSLADCDAEDETTRQVTLFSPSTAAAASAFCNSGAVLAPFINFDYASFKDTKKKLPLFFLQENLPGYLILKTVVVSEHRVTLRACEEEEEASGAAEKL
ncbi:hypothetical protein RUND412_004673 [Rhizina undulata]